MDKRIELAKSQGLNWQAMLIEEAQTDLKVLIKDEVLKKSNLSRINKKVDELINKVIGEIELQSLKESALKGLRIFASRLYAYYRATFQNFGLVEVVALNAVLNKVATAKQVEIANKAVKEILPVIYERRVPLDIFAEDYMDNVNKRLDYVAKMQAKEDYTTRLSLRNIAEMQVRQEGHINELANLKEKDINLVWIVPHANASKRCTPFQGRLYSLDGTYGEINGENYVPLENATDIYEVTKSGKVYKNGIISGFNCRHKLLPYKKGNKPVEIPAKIVSKEREINDKQRYYERAIRLWKDEALQFKGIDTRKYIFARQKVKEWNEKYIQFSQANKVAYYPSRTEI